MHKIIFPSVIMLPKRRRSFAAGLQDFIVIFLDNRFRIITNGRLNGHEFLQRMLHEYLGGIIPFPQEYIVCGGGTLRYDGKEKDSIFVFSQSGVFGDFDPKIVKNILEYACQYVEVEEKERKPVEKKIFAL